MDNETPPENTENKKEPEFTFKKPTILTGKVGKLPKKTITVKTVTAIEDNSPKEENVSKAEPSASKSEPSASKPPQVPNIAVKSPELSYIEPPWSGPPPDGGKPYKLEVLKSGVILETINLMPKRFWVFGRLPSCDISMAHPTISRFHTIIQYKAEPSEDMPIGFYIYDLGSTHGTFLNKLRIKPGMYVRMQVGHMLRLGCSTRTYLLDGPDDDAEEESELSVTELKRLRLEEIRQREEKEREESERAAAEKERRKKEEEERGIDWGMGEDADEETDLTINPYAETNNEDLYKDDPKKALKHFFEREGLDLHYDCTERGLGQFYCTVDLPLDDAKGRPIVAEVLHKGKKKEAVIQCALEACRVLDRHGLLRQSAQESKKRKAKNWEENDYYDSDEDTFLDRTGTIEKKREKRMRANQPQQPETYQSLCVKEKTINEKIKELERELDEINKSKENKNRDESETDSLDSFMKELNENTPDKYKIGRLKNELTQLRKEHAETVRLVNLTRPADLPALVVENASTAGSSKPAPKSLPIFGKRLKVKVTVPSRTDTVPVDSDEESETDQAEASTSSLDNCEGILEKLESKLLNCNKTALQSLDNKLKEKISKTVVKLRKIAEEEESIIVDEKRLAVQKRKLIEQVNIPANNIQIKQLNRITDEFCTLSDRKIKMVDKINKLAEDINQIAVEIRKSILLHNEDMMSRWADFIDKMYDKQVKVYNELLKLNKPDERIVDKLTELHDWLSERKTKMIENLEKIKQLKDTLNMDLIQEIVEYEKSSNDFVKTIIDEIRKIQNENDDETDEPAESPKSEDESEPSDKKKKKNIRRIMQRQEKAENEKKKQYEEDATREDYNMWVPPEGQTGDGRTSLNDKYGY